VRKVVEGRGRVPDLMGKGALVPRWVARVRREEEKPSVWEAKERGRKRRSGREKRERSGINGGKGGSRTFVEAVLKRREERFVGEDDQQESRRK